MKVRELHPGMGQAVAERTILRKKENGKWETWGDVAKRVALGNSLLCPNKDDQEAEYKALYSAIAKGMLLMSGRHLQHGDKDQPNRNMEVFTNCSTANNSFILFYLLMNGSGVGRSYDDDLMLVNWDHAPALLCVLDEKHPDFNCSAHESVRDAKHKYGKGEDVLWHHVADTREGWAKALEIWENAAFEKVHRDKLLILDFSNIRPKGSPIKGMQNRPASGPVPLMNAFNKAYTIKGAGMSKFMQSMYIDHYFAECVLVGGARRAARIGVKYWKDKTVLDFITIKRPIEYDKLNVDEVLDIKKNLKPQGFLWSSNNSIGVDKEFWDLVNLKRSSPEYKTELAFHARRVFKTAIQCAYTDGEPGFINLDKLTANDEGLDKIEGDYIGSQKYKVNEDTRLYLNKLLNKCKKKTYKYIVNPCVSGDTWVQTSEGPRQVHDLIDKPFKAVVNGKEYQSNGFWETGIKDVYLIETKRGFSVKATKNHKFLVKNCNSIIWKEVQDLTLEDEIILNDNRNVSWEGEGTFDDGVASAKSQNFNFGNVSSNFCSGFLNYCFKSKNNYIINESQDRLKFIQKMLARFGILSTIYKQSNNSYSLNLDNNLENIELFDKITESNIAICVLFSSEVQFYDKVKKIEFVGKEKVYDCTVDEIHRFDANGFIAHNCGEIVLSCFSGVCVVGDASPSMADTIEEAEESFRTITRALIRINTMNALYSKEIKRTNRIGVSITGVHEFAHKFFNFGFYDLINEEKSIKFWKTLARFKKVVQEEAESYSKKLGMVVPHTDTTIKPAGTTSKLFCTTEGLHLPTMPYYLRWVQFSNDDPLVEIYEKNGYPVRKLKSYKNTKIIGFPTTLEIASLNDKLVTAEQATPEEQYKLLELTEKYYLRGVNDDGTPLEKDTSNQISYTLKYNTDTLDFQNFVLMVKKYQSKIKCCSLMPQSDRGSYEYLPEEPVTKAEYENIYNKIKKVLSEDVDFAHISCDSGACPIDFREKK